MNNEFNKGRKINLDILKAICAYMVIVIHCGFPFWDAYMDAFSRVAVPIWFMIAGYFCKGHKEEIKRKVINLLKIYVVGEVIYISYALYTQGEAWKLWISQELHAIGNTLWNVLVYNNTRIFKPGWFLLALIYAYLLYGLIVKLGIKKQAYLFIPILILWWWGWQRAYMLLRIDLNFLDVKILRAMPFFLLGNLFKYKENEIRQWMTGRKVFLLLAIGTLLVYFERNMIEQLVFKPALSLYLGNVVVALGGFAWALYMPEFKWLKFFAYIGEKLSMYIYVIHMLVMEMFANRQSYTYILKVCVVSTIVAWGIYFLKNIVKNN